MNLLTTIEAVYAGGLQCLEPEGQRTGIFKRKIADATRIEINGIVGDEHGDLRVHGGPEKAIHHYAAQHYVCLADAFPSAKEMLVAGSLGENISSHHFSEVNVHIGDVFQLGTARVQVSQPRSPCWKINHRFDVERISMFMAQEHITGWYYRVLDQGVVKAGDEILLLERQTDRFSIDQFWKVQLSRQPCIDNLVDLAAVPGLAVEWKKRLTERVIWLRKRLETPV